MALKRLAVYCGARDGADPMHLAAARSVGAEIARSGFGLIYGGASIGLMGVVADAALSEGGEVIGVLPETLLSHEPPHGSLSRLEIVPSFHTRKARIMELADGFIALSGGVGTLEELLEVTTLKRLGVHQKPIGVIASGNFYETLKELISKCAATGFTSTKASEQWIEHEVPEKLVELVGIAASGSTARNYAKIHDCHYEDLVQLVKDVPHSRTLETLPRRIMKAMEELGELNQAYLSVSSPKGTKQSSWAAVREELTDLFIVVSDLLLTRLPPEDKLSGLEFQQQICSEVTRKVNVWRQRMK